MVVTTASPEGLGFHSVFGPGTQLRERGTGSGFGGRARGRDDTRQILFSPNLTRYEVRSLYGDQVIFCKHWDEVIGVLEEIHGSSLRVGVFPCGALQYGV